MPPTATKHLYIQVKKGVSKPYPPTWWRGVRAGLIDDYLSGITAALAERERRV